MAKGCLHKDHQSSDGVPSLILLPTGRNGSHAVCWKCQVTHVIDVVSQETPVATLTLPAVRRQLPSPGTVRDCPSQA